MTSRQLVIIGAGGHGREILDIVEASNMAADRTRWEFLGFLDDGRPDQEVLRRRGSVHLGPISLLADMDASYLVGVGAPAVRRRITGRCDVWGRAAATLVHPMASVGSDSTLGAGTILAAGARVTTNVLTGRHVHLNVNSVVHHDVVVSDFVTIGPGATVCGGARVGSDTWIGANATVNQKVGIGAGVMLGSGAVAVRDLPQGVTAFGVPARPQTSGSETS